VIAESRGRPVSLVANEAPCENRAVQPVTIVGAGTIGVAWGVAGR